MPLRESETGAVAPEHEDKLETPPSVPHFMLMTDRIAHKFVAIPVNSVLWINDGNGKIVPLVLHDVSPSAIRFRMYDKDTHNPTIYTYKLVNKVAPHTRKVNIK